MKKTGYLTLLKNKTFLKIWLVQLLSLITAYMLNFILMDKIYTATRSTIAVGLFWGFYILPSATLGPFVGVFLDYLSKRKIFVVSSLLQSLIVLLYLGISLEKIWPIYTIVLFYSFCDEFFNPAVGAFIPSIVKKEELPAANSFYLFTTQGSIIAGFMIGGAVLRFFDFAGLPFLVACGFLLLASGLSLLIPPDKPALERKLQLGFKEFLSDLTEGYQFIKGEPRVLLSTGLLFGLQIILGVGLILLPSVSREHLKIQFADSSFVIIVPGLLGGILGGILTERLLKKHLKRFLIIGGLYLLGFFVLALAFLPFLVGSPGNFAPFLAMVMGIAGVIIYIPLQTLVQEHTPFDVRGRVFGTLNTLITLAAAIPVLITTTVVDFLGISLVMFLLGAGLIFVASYSARGKYGIIPANYRH